MSSIYEEAIIESKKLKEVAVQNAKNELVEAVTPSIRKMVDDFITGKVKEEVSPEDLLEEVSQKVLPKSEETETIVKESHDSKDSFIKDVDHITLKLKEEVDNFSKFDSKEGKSFLEEMKNKVNDTYNQLDENKKNIDAESFEMIKDRLDSLLETIEEENKMFESQASLEEIFLGEEEEELDLDTEEVPVEDFEGEEEVDVDSEELESDDEELDIDLEAVESALGQLGDALGLDVQVGGDEEVEGDEEFDFEVDAEADVEGDEVEFDFEEPAEELEDGAFYESSCSEGEDEELTEEASCDCPDGECSCEKVDESVFEINENELKDEIVRMKKLRESKSQGNPSNDKLVKEMTSLKKQNETLRAKLNESELFSAKLLYTNKLLQNKGLTDKQKLHVVESLDSAKSLREVKLLFKTLTEGQEKSNQTLTESIKRRRNIGSASRTTKSGSASAQNPDNGKEQLSENHNPRWMVMAGLKNLND